MPRYVMVIDQSRCIGCMSCVVACKRENDVPEEHHRTRVVEMVRGQFPHLRTEMRSELCNHCDNPPCVHICPTGASHQQEDGTVQIDRRTCVGCKACITACPYDVRYIDPEHGYVDKCSFCQHRLKEGKEPACVATCVGGSRMFGDLDDPNSHVRQLLRNNSSWTLKPEVGTKPHVYYINKFPRKS